MTNLLQWKALDMTTTDGTLSITVNGQHRRVTEGITIAPFVR